MKIELDKRVFPISSATDLIHTAMETSGVVNLLNNIIHVFTHEQICIYPVQDNSFKLQYYPPRISVIMTEKSRNLCVKIPHVTINMHY